MLSLQGYFTTPHDYLVLWQGVPDIAKRVLLQYRYRDRKHCIDVTGKNYYVISDIHKAFPEYTITLLVIADDKIKFSTSRWWGPRSSILAKESITSRDTSPEVREFLLAIQKGLQQHLSGTEFYILPLKTQGRACSCTISRGTPDPNCKICYGTGIVGGYDTPISTLGMVMMKNTVDGVTLMQPARVVVEQTQLLVPYGWELRRGDVLFDVYARKGYKVISNIVSYLADKYPIMQMVSVNELLKGSVIYDHPTITHSVFESRTKSNYLHNRLP
jgi:hypothetical protein